MSAQNVWRKIAVVISAIILLIAIFALEPSHVQERASVIGIGVDKNENQYEISVQVIVPTGGSSDSQQTDYKGVISAKGINLGDAINNLSTIMGRKLLLMHCNVMVIGETLDNDNLLEFIDYIMRTNRINDSAFIMRSAVSAKELLSMQSTMDSYTSMALQKSSLEHISRGNTVSVNIMNYAKQTKEAGHCAIIPCIVPVKVAKPQGDISTSGGANEEVEEYLFNSEQTGVYKNGEFACLMDKSQTKGYNWIIDEEKLNDGSIESPDFGVKVKKRKADWKVDFDENGDPDVNINVELDVEIEEKGKLNEPFFYKLEDDMKEELVSIVKEDINSLLDLVKRENADIIGLGIKMHKKQLKEYRRLYDKYGDDYISRANFNVNVEIKKKH